MGNAIHAALRDWFDIGTARRTPQDGAGLVRLHWSSRGFRDAGQSAQWREAAADMTEDYLPRRPAPPATAASAPSACWAGTSRSAAGSTGSTSPGRATSSSSSTTRRAAGRPPTTTHASSRALALYAAHGAALAPAAGVRGPVAPRPHRRGGQPPSHARRLAAAASSPGRTRSDAISPSPRADASAGAYPPTVRAAVLVVRLPGALPEACALPEPSRGWAGLPDASAEGAGTFPA